jgi:multisubunit Na+/H+ antiporter MnhC subunit
MNTLTTLTVIAISVAAAMTALVLRLVFEERRRSAARVASLEADIYRTEEEDILVLHDPPSLERNVRTLRNPAPPQTLSLAPLVAVFAATAFALFAGVTRYRAISSEPDRPPATQAADQVLQLLSLDHEQASDRLTVRGVVRNPPRGSEMDHLTAVVLLFNQQGGFLTSGRSPIESATLQPGTEAKFVVTVPGAADVGKYRVSFRTDDRVVPHVDRRW